MEKPLKYRFGHGSDAQHREDQALFKALLKEHGSLKRQTINIENGIISSTTATNPELVNILQAHVTGMQERFEMGRAIRSWDPLFAALFEYKDQITLSYKNIENGVEATLTTHNPMLVELIQCHDQTLHNFVNEGFAAGGRESPKPSWLT